MVGLPKAIRQEKETKGIRIEKRDIKLFLFADDILYIESNNLLHLINESGQVAGNKINIKKWVAFLYINNNLPEGIIEIDPIYTSIQTSTIFTNI